MTGYPPQPWELRGQLHLTVWRVPSVQLPRLKAGLRPVRAGGTALVGTAWVIYEPGGVLSYRELLVAVLAHRGGRPLVTITDIWVDSAPALHGGRELWGIPKQTARRRAHPQPGPLHLQGPADPDQLGVRARRSAQVACRGPAGLLDLAARLRAALRAAVSSF